MPPTCYDIRVHEFIGKFGPDGRDVAAIVWNDRPFTATSANGATCKLARSLVAAGAPDAPWQVSWPDGRVRFSGPSLHRWARLTIYQPDIGSMSLRPYRENPRFPTSHSVQDGDGDLPR